MLRRGAIVLWISLLSLVYSNILIEKVTLSKDWDRRAYNGTTFNYRRKREVDKNTSAANVTTLLKRILQNYDKNFHPHFAQKEPTDVYIDIFVRTMGPFSELTDTWRDERLMFDNGSSGSTLSLAMSMLDKIWKPDTYFWNGAGSYLHMMTSPNRLVRLKGDGTVLFSSRLTVKAKCRMQLSRYPLDRQACRLIIGSFAYGANELLYKWKHSKGDDAVQIDHAAITQLPQFGVTGQEIFNTTIINRDVPYSALEVRFYLDRHFGYFLMNFYVPCTLIVLLCWVAFWINREATNDRLGLGIMSVLTMTFLLIDSKADAPKVDFPTAIDVYIWICYMFIFGCIVEFTVVHYHTKFNTGDPELQELEREKMKNMLRSIPKRAVLRSVVTVVDIRCTIETEKVAEVERGCSPHNSQHLPTNATDLHFWIFIGKQSDGDCTIGLQIIFSRVALPITFGIVVIAYYNFYVNSPFIFHFEDYDFN